MAKPTMAQLLAMTPEEQHTNLKQYGNKVAEDQSSYYDRTYTYDFDTVRFIISTRLGVAVNSFVDQSKVYVTFPTLTITAEDKSKVAGAANPTLTATYAGFVEGDTVDDFVTLPTISTTAVTESEAGTYPITATGAVFPKYNIVYVDGTLTVTTP